MMLYFQIIRECLYFGRNEFQEKEENCVVFSWRPERPILTAGNLYRASGQNYRKEIFFFC